MICVCTYSQFFAVKKEEHFFFVEKSIKLFRFFGHDVTELLIIPSKRKLNFDCRIVLSINIPFTRIKHLLDVDKSTKLKENNNDKAKENMGNLILRTSLFCDKDRFVIDVNPLFRLASEVAEWLADMSSDIEIPVSSF